MISGNSASGLPLNASCKVSQWLTAETVEDLTGVSALSQSQPRLPVRVPGPRVARAGPGLHPRQAVPVHVVLAPLTDLGW